MLLAERVAAIEYTSTVLFLKFTGTPINTSSLLNKTICILDSAIKKPSIKRW